MKRITALWLILATLLAVPVLGAAESFAEFRAKAEKGDATAQSNLGWMYETGEGVAKDPTEAVKWYRKACSLSD